MDLDQKLRTMHPLSTRLGVPRPLTPRRPSNPLCDPSTTRDLDLSIILSTPRRPSNPRPLDDPRTLLDTLSFLIFKKRGFTFFLFSSYLFLLPRLLLLLLPLLIFLFPSLLFLFSFSSYFLIQH